MSHGSHQPVLIGISDGLGSVAGADLTEQVVDVAFYRRFVDKEPLGDLTISEPVRDQREHFGLSRRQAVRKMRGGTSLRQGPAGDDV